MNPQNPEAPRRTLQTNTGLRRELPQGYFTPADIAVYIGLSTYTIQELCRRGELRHVKVGRAIRIRREWADQYMTAREREPLQ